MGTYPTDAVKQADLLDDFRGAQKDYGCRHTVAARLVVLEYDCMELSTFPISDKTPVLSAQYHSIPSLFPYDSVVSGEQYALSKKR